VFTQELLDWIVDDWNVQQQYSGDEKMSNNEIAMLLENLQRELNVHQGNSKPAKFYTYRQNNSGGSFVGPLYVCVEAESEEEAEEIAQENGVYFNGCSTGRDCSCRGDRWYCRPEENDFPGCYGEPLPELCSDKSQYLIVRKS